MRIRLLLLLLLVTAGLLPAQAAGDALVLDNGDRLQGQLLTIGGGKVTFKTDYAPKLQVPLARVRSLTTAGPVDLVFADGRKKKGRLVLGGDGGSGEGVYAFANFTASGLKVVNPAPPPVYKWEGSLAAGYTAARGNSRSDSMSFKADATRRWEKSRLTLDFSWFYQRTYDDTTREWELGQRQARGGAKYDYFISKKLYAYGTARGEKDDQQDLDFRSTVGAGLGYQFIERDDLKVAGEAGMGYDNRDFAHGVDSEENGVFRIADNVKWSITKDLEFVHKGELLTTTTGSREHTATVDFGLRALFTASFFAQLQASYRWETETAPGTKRLDEQYIFSVGWKF